MRFDTTEIDSLPTTQEVDYKAAPTKWETFQAYKKNTLASGILESESNYAQDAMVENVDMLIKNDPANEDIYNILKAQSKANLKFLESQYQDGTLTKYRPSNDQTAQAYTLYKQNAGKFNVPDTEETFEIAKAKAKKDYDESLEVMERSDHFFTGMAGAMWGQLHSPTQLALLPAGGSAKTVVGGIAKTAATLAAREIAYAAPYEAVAAAQEYDYKNDLDIRFTIKDAATNATIGTLAPGLLRGGGSAAFDLTAKGIKNLKAVDPELGADYENLVSKKITDTDEEHLFNMQQHEYGQKVNTDNPTPEMEKIIKSGPQREFEDVPDVELPTGKKYEAESLHMGEDVEGNPILKSYKEMDDELVQEEKWIKQIEDCLLKG